MCLQMLFMNNINTCAIPLHTPWRHLSKYFEIEQSSWHGTTLFNTRSDVKPGWHASSYSHAGWVISVKSFHLRNSWTYRVEIHTIVGYGSVAMLMIRDLILNSFIIYLIWLFIRYKTIVENNYTIAFVANKCRTLI